MVYKTQCYLRVGGIVMYFRGQRKICQNIRTGNIVICLPIYYQVNTAIYNNCQCDYVKVNNITVLLNNVFEAHTIQIRYLRDSTKCRCDKIYQISKPLLTNLIASRININIRNILHNNAVMNNRNFKGEAQSPQ